MIPLSPATASTLIGDACDEIRHAHNKMWADINSKGVARPQWEPRFVAALCVCMGNVAATWKTTLLSAHPGHSVSVSAVFTHQTPQVEWPIGSPTRRCELADLLIAFIDRPAAKGFATLIQAKQSDSNSVTLSSTSEKTQYDLLSGRPVFDVVAKSAPASVNSDRPSKAKRSLAASVV